MIRNLDAGDVVTYGEVAALAGKPGAARGAGAVLAANHDPDLPWWRVVNASGRLAPGKERAQARRLRAEGVEIRGDRVAGFSGRGDRRPGRATGSS